MTTSSDIPAEFQRRRSKTWKAIRWWLVLAIAAFVTAFLSPQGSTLELSRAQFSLHLVCLVAAGTAIIAMTRAVYTHYRCPSCNSVPMRRMSSGGGAWLSYRTGVDLSPSSCPTCGAKLRSDAQ